MSSFLVRSSSWLTLVSLPLACAGDPISLGDHFPSDTDGTDSAGVSSTGELGATGSIPPPADGGHSSGDTPALDSTSGASVGKAGDDQSEGTTGVGGSEGSNGGEGMAGTDTDAGVDGAAVLFVNFDGVTLTQGTDDATADVSSLAKSLGEAPLAPYGVGHKRDEIMASLAKIWAPFDMTITDTRPVSGDYAMVVVTSTTANSMGALGIAESDCGDVNPTSVGVGFGSVGDGTSAEVMAVVISYLAASGFGLEAVQTIGAMMYPVARESKEFVDACLPLAANKCAVQHEVFCPPGLQNSHAELSALSPL